MLTPLSTRKYKKSFKKLKQSGKFKEEGLNEVIDMLCKGQILDPTYQDHPLHGEYEGYRECHIRGDILLIYEIKDQELILVLINIGSHSELF
ncbi:type II toxin-antitoxin system YafQ family toxin [Candidatus Nomurabacteria bacterium]|nr:type II toxin-antitoxin system YafQ family toxin [Candidatus Nomurabacteria bacterium]